MLRIRHARESLLALHLLGAATVLVACQEEALWNDKSFDKLVSSDAAMPYESAEPAPQPPPTQVSKAPFGEEPKDLTFLICFALENNPSTRATWERAKVTAANKGGLECEVAGLRGFMPASLVSTWRIENLEEMVGQTLDSLVTEIVPEARRLVLSRRAVIEKQAADAKAKMLETLEPGVEFDGIVRSVREFGAFVDIGNGVEGLIHVSELSWDRVANAADVLKAGEKVRVIVKKVDQQTGKIGLSIRDLIESPWKRAADKYHVGSVVKGVVSRIAQFGAFVKLEPGVEGLVHVSELATRHIRNVADVAREGQEVECRVISVDPDEQRMSLSIKALAPAPAAKDRPANEHAAEEPESPPPPVTKKRNAFLKGGTGSGQSQGEKFGLKW
jgi:small subunit ribosomal protein S1